MQIDILVLKYSMECQFHEIKFILPQIALAGLKTVDNKKVGKLVHHNEGICTRGWVSEGREAPPPSV